MRKALVVGIDHYNYVTCLNGCVNDAYSVKSVLERNADGTPNFGVNLLVGTGPGRETNRRQLRDAIKQLFADDSDVALFYFSGHGYIDNTWGYLITSDCRDGNDGVAMDELLVLANESTARSKVIILDSCHSGLVGAPSTIPNHALLSEGVTILTASTASQYAIETGGSGVFTRLLVDALNGSASNLVGDITPGSVYAHIDQSLGPWEQRPVFKTNVKTFTTLRKVLPPIDLIDLRKITELFIEPSEEYQLDPSFEPESDSPKTANVEKFRVLQKLNRLNLVVPVGAEHMYFAAMNSKSCKLTVLGVHYWNLVAKGRI